MSAKHRLAKRITEDNPVFGALPNWTKELGGSGYHQFDRRRTKRPMRRMRRIPQPRLLPGPAKSRYRQNYQSFPPKSRSVT